VPDRENRIRILPSHLTRRAIDHADERLEAPAHVLSFVDGDDAEIRRLGDVRAADELAVRRRPDAPPGRVMLDVRRRSMRFVSARFFRGRAGERRRGKEESTETERDDESSHDAKKKP
jgi:hypothetical protein